MTSKQTLREFTWIARFVPNCRRNVPKFEGPITAAEQESRTDWWIRRVQARAMSSPEFAADKMQLNLQTNMWGNLGVSWEDSRSLPSLLARWLPVHREVRTTITTSHSRRGRGSYNGRHPGASLGTALSPSREEDHQELRWGYLAEKDFIQNTDRLKKPCWWLFPDYK